MARNDARSRDDAMNEQEMSPGATIEDDDYDEFDVGAITGYMNLVPNLPEIPGYHCAWIPVSSDVINQDNQWVASSMMGYSPITVDEFTSYSNKKYGKLIAEKHRVKGGEHANCVKVKDVVACKIPLAIRRRIDAAIQRQTDQMDDSIRGRPDAFQGSRARLTLEANERGVGSLPEV